MTPQHLTPRQCVCMHGNKIDRGELVRTVVLFIIATHKCVAYTRRRVQCRILHLSPFIQMFVQKERAERKPFNQTRIEMYVITYSKRQACRCWLPLLVSYQRCVLKIYIAPLSVRTVRARIEHAFAHLLPNKQRTNVWAAKHKHVTHRIVYSVGIYNWMLYLAVMYYSCATFSCAQHIHLPYIFFHSSFTVRAFVWGTRI